MPEIKFEDLLGTGAHFGHVTRKWNPNFKSHILLEKNGVHIINLESTIEGFNKAAAFVKEIISKNGEILFVGTKKQAQDIVQQEADKCSMFYIVERWLGGTLTNFSTIKKSIKRLKMLEKEGSNLYENLTKKETQMLNRERVKLADQHRGIKDMRRLPDAVIVVDAQYEDTAIREAKRLFIPVIAIVDSNTDPSKVDYPIPANDDSIRTIQLIIAALADAVNEARGTVAEKNKKKSEKKLETDASEQPVPENELKVESVPEEVAVEGVVEVTAENSEEIPEPAETPEVQESEDISRDSTQKGE
ncbi:MAG: 30S ribosomal protein S2 [Candidatus Marinimicrobia bacterium]|nr:30S ribosomal protein S2 [Candidatus Neomarinimicrobiota bacterium]